MPNPVVYPEPQTRFGDDAFVSLGTELLRVRNAHGWTRAQASKRSGIAASTIQRLETTDSTPRLRTLREYLDGLSEGTDGITAEEANSIAVAAGLAWHANSDSKDADIRGSSFEDEASALMLPADLASIVRLCLDLLVQAGPARTIAALESLIKATTKATPLRSSAQESQQLRSISAPITRPDGATEHVIRTYDVKRIPPPAPAKKKAN